MYWQETSEQNKHNERASVVDMAFRIHCRCLPLDHAYDLRQAITTIIPWIEDDDTVGIHSIRGAESGNGWYRPMQQDGLMQLSKRVRLILRVPEDRQNQCAALCGRTLYLSSHKMTVNNYSVRTINPMPTLFARAVVTDAAETEESFMGRSHDSLNKMGIDVPKMLSGRRHKIKLPDRYLVARSLLLSDVSIPDSLKLQEVGLGVSRKLGCGLFVPHKSISAVNQSKNC